MTVQTVEILKLDLRACLVLCYSKCGPQTTSIIWECVRSAESPPPPHQLVESPWTIACQAPHGILQARILEWAAIPFSRGPSGPRYRTQISCIAGRFLTILATREANIALCQKQLAS